MCGRFFSTVTPSDLGLAFGLDVRSNMEPRDNIAPTQAVDVVRLSEQGKRQLTPMRWGLVPAWAKQVGTTPLINARAETVDEKPSFRGAYKYRRGIVPATGWYEWRTENKRKLPFAHRLPDQSLLGFACIWELWEGRGEGSWLESFALLTMEAIGPAAAIHHRMPVLMHPDNYQSWLGGAREILPRPSEMPGHLIDQIEVVAVDPAINKVAGQGQQALLL
jgi:putative SOS response-associated peptidase YedK